MGIFTNYRKDMESNRATNAIIMKATLDTLKVKDGSDEARENLVNSTKEVLDSYMTLEADNAKLEYYHGKLVGLTLAAGIEIVCFMVGKGIDYLVNKNK